MLSNKVLIDVDYLPTLILRHRRENLKKCSLRGLEKRKDMRFLTYPRAICLSLDHYVMLSIDAPPLSEADQGYGIFLLDASWRWAEVMQKQVERKGAVRKRSLPSHFRTAYPRRQDDCSLPEQGLASVEALYIAYVLLERDPSGLLDGYHWKEIFLNQNRDYLS